MKGRWKPEDRTPLALLRFKAGYSREQAAVKMKISSRSLANYENEAQNISFDICEQMSKIYHVNFEDIRQAILATKEIANKSPAKSKPLKDREIMNMALKNADNLKEAAI